MTLNWLAIVALSVVFFGLGAFWFGPLFGKLWMKIHGFEKKSKADMDRTMQGMWKLMAGEFVATFMTVMTLDFLIQILPEYSGVHVGFMVWLGFVLPTYITATLWGNDEKKWMIPKIALSAGYRLVMLLVC